MYQRRLLTISINELFKNDKCAQPQYIVRVLELKVLYNGTMLVLVQFFYLQTITSHPNRRRE